MFNRISTERESCSQNVHQAKETLELYKHLLDDDDYKRLADENKLLSLETEALKDFRWWRLERKQIAKSLLKETGTHLRIVETTTEDALNPIRGSRAPSSTAFSARSLKKARSLSPPASYAPSSYSTRMPSGKPPPTSYAMRAGSSRYRSPSRASSGASTSRAGRHRSPLSQSSSDADPILRAFSGRASSSHSRRSSSVRPASERELAMVPYRRGRSASAASSSLHPSDAASGALLARYQARLGAGSAVSSPLRPSDSVSNAGSCCPNCQRSYARPPAPPAQTVTAVAFVMPVGVVVLCQCPRLAPMPSAYRYGMSPYTGYGW